MNALVESARKELGLPSPSLDWWSRLHARLPIGVREAVVQAVEDGWITTDGWRFRFARGGSLYKFFSKASLSPAPNWEAFVHVAIYGQFCAWVEPLGLRCSGEDHSLDIAIRNHADEILWYIEVKETAAQIQRLVAGIASYGSEGVPSGPPARDDALSKAQDLVTHRPAYFSLAAIGARLDFAVTYDGERSFELIRDCVALPLATGWQQSRP